jgi:hypothetical protein
MSARRRAKVVPLPTPPAKRPERWIDEDLLYLARQDAFLLLLALDGLDRDGTYVHEDTELQSSALRNLAGALSGKLATIGRQAAGEPEP